MTKILTTLRTSKLSGISFLSVMMILGTVAPAFAANLNINDSVEAQITLNHDPNWEFGVTSNGVAYAPNISGSELAIGESTSFSGTWFVNSGGNPDPGNGIIYILDPNTNQVSDIVTASWSTVVQPGFDIASIAVSVTSSAKCSDLGELPDGFTGIVETGGSMQIGGQFVDPATGVAVSIPSNLTIQFVTGTDECEIDVEKTWTHTDYNWDQVCDGFVNNADDLCYEDDLFTIPMDFRPANTEADDVLAETLFPDGDGKYLLWANLKNNGNFQNTNPGAFYALTTVEVFEDVDGLEVTENYSDCTNPDGDLETDDDGILKLHNKKDVNNVKIAVADSNDDVTELTDDLMDGIGGSISADGNSALVDIDQFIEAGSTVYVLVKFQDNLKGFNMGEEFDLMCDNTESVDAIISDQTVGSKSAEASVRITNLES